WRIGKTPFPCVEAVTLIDEAGGKFTFAPALPESRLAAVGVARPFVEGQYPCKVAQITHSPNHLLEKWTCNADGRQAAFWKRRGERKFTASFIDQGYCFNAGEWSFPDAPLRGVFGRNDV